LVTPRSRTADLASDPDNAGSTIARQFFGLNSTPTALLTKRSV
jgi:hypothetical protein